LLRMLWPAYATAEPHKAYNLQMLISRLMVDVACSLAGGFLAATVAKSNAAAWVLGALLLFESSRIHFFKVWADYPSWYHFAYLLSLMPVIRAGAHLSGRTTATHTGIRVSDKMAEQSNAGLDQLRRGRST